MSLDQLLKDIDIEIKRTTDQDNDVEEMAVVKLTDIIHQHASQIPEPKMVQIVQAILNHLDSDQNNIQNNAVKSLVQIMSKLSTENCHRVVARIVTRIANPENKQTKALASIYTNNLITIIKDVGYEYGYQLKDLVKMIVNAIFNIKSSTDPKIQDDNVIVQLNLIDILQTFMVKWPRIIENVEFDKPKFVEYLLGNIGHPKLSKKSYLCLGALTSSLKQKQINMVIIENNGLLKKIKSESKYAKTKQSYYALATILKSKNIYIAPLVSEIYKFIIAEIKKFQSHEDLGESEDAVEDISKLLDCLIKSLHSLIIGFHNDFKELTQNTQNELVSVLNELIIFSPVRYISYIKNNSFKQQEQEEEEADDSSDSSYLVRASVLELVGYFCSINLKICEKFIESQELFLSLTQNQTQVRNSSFNMFENLFIGISREQSCELQDNLPGLRREISIFKEKVPSLLTKFLKQITQLFRNDKVDNHTKVGCSRLLRQIPRTFLFTLSNDNKLNLIDQIYEIILEQLKKTKSIQIQTLLINTIQCLGRYSHLQYSIKSINFILYILPSVHNENLLRSIFTAIACHLCEGYQGFSKNSQLLAQIFDVTQKYANQQNLELTIRISINQTILMLINHYNSILPQRQVAESLNTILNKLKEQRNKLHLLNGLKTLPQSFKAENKVKEILSKIVLFIGQNLINNKLADVKQGAHLSILAIIKILGNYFQPHATKLLEFSGTLIDGRQFPEYLIELSRAYPNLFANNLNKLINLQGVHPSVIINIISKNNISLQNVVNIIKNNLTPDNLLFSVDIFALLKVNAKDFEKQINDSLWGSLCLRLLGLSGNPAYFELIMNYCRTLESSKTKENARLSLGDLSASNPQTSIPKLMDQFFKTKSDDMDLVFISLQQCIIKTDHKYYGVIQATLTQIFKMIEQNNIVNESVINRIAQCSAKLYNSNAQKGSALLLGLSNSKYINIRYLFATSLSYIDPHLFNRDLINKLIELYQKDQLKIKVAAAKSISHLININSVEMKKFITSTFYNSIRQSARFDEKLVVVEVIGVKTRVDKGKPLRIQSFFILQQILAKQIHQGLDLTDAVRTAIDVGNDIYQDVLFHRLDLIRLATSISPKSLINIQKQFVDQFDPIKGVLKTYVKQGEDQTAKKTSLNIVRKIFEICLNCKKENSLILENFNLQLKSNPKFKTLLDEEDD